MSRKLYMDLSLNSEITRPEQYKLAWKAITSDNLAEAWNAKCWLTYRACDGEIGIDEWRQHVSVNTPAVLDTQIGYRWHVSQLLAEVYLHTLHGHPIELEQCRVALLNLAPRVAEWPFAGLHFLRNDALSIYQEYVGGRPSTQMIGEAMSRWTRSIAVTHPALHPRRYWEMGDDMEALRVIAKLTNPHDATVPAVVLNPRRIFSKCLLKIGESAIHEDLAVFGKPESRLIIGSMVPNDGQLIELGVAKGQFAEDILTAHPHIKYLGIDKWDDKRHPAREAAEALNRIARFGSRATLIKSTFADALPHTPMADVIYIDGYAHTGQDGAKTLEDWLPKVKPGGIIAGHDYDEKHWPDTFREVNAFAERHGLTINIIRGDQYPSWWCRTGK